MNTSAEIEITELEKIDATRVDGVGTPANGIPILLMKSVELPDEAAKDWAAWDAAHEGGGGGKAGTKGNTRADAAAAVARAKQTIADHKAGKPVSAADLKNAHEVHEAHLAHLARLKAEGKEPKGAAKPKATAKPAATAKKGARDCPSCDAEFDADHKGNTCPECGAKLPDGDNAEKSFDREAAKSLVRGIIAKAVGADGEVDEEPDVEGGTHVLEMIADLIIAEAQELKAGQAGEIADILELACAAEKIWCWRTGEEAVGSGSVMPATALMQSAVVKELVAAELARAFKGLPTPEFGLSEDFAKAGPTAEERRKAAADGNALSDGSYPIRNEHELHAAAILARSGHGDVEGAKRLISRRAKELGVKNPLEHDDDTSKSRLAEEETAVDTVTQGNDGQIAKAVEDAVTKALAASEGRIKALEDELAKVKAQPVPGGPMMTRTQPAKAEDGVDHAAKAREYDAWSQNVSDPSLAEKYSKLAARHRDAIDVS